MIKFKYSMLSIFLCMSVIFAQQKHFTTGKTKWLNVRSFTSQVIDRGIIYIPCQDSVLAVTVEIKDSQHTHRYVYDLQDSLWREITNFYPKH